MASIDQQFVEYIVKTLVNNPDKVEVSRQIDEKGVLLSLTVDPEDVGRVIGRRGATAQSIRTLLRALGTKNDARYNLKIVNTDELADHETKERAATTPATDSIADASTEDEETEEAEDDETEGPEDSEDDDSPVDDLAEKTRAELADLDDLDI